jgi:Rrf2 family protein
MMKLSNTSAYAIHVMVHVAEHAPRGSATAITGHQAADTLSIPEGFLLRILVALSRGQLLTSMKGPHGGYRLARAAEDITVLDIIEAAEGPMRSGGEPVSDKPDALDIELDRVFSQATKAARKDLAGLTLAGLAKAGNGRTKKARATARK